MTLVSPGLRLPRVQVSLVMISSGAGIELTKITSAGQASVTITLYAISVPMFVTVIV